MSERTLYDLIELSSLLDSVGTRTISNVVINAHGKGIRLLENHPHVFPQLADINIAVYQFLTSIFDVAFEFYIRDQIVHTV